MATELFKCDYCNTTLHKNATLVHTERYHGLWDLDCSICSACFKHFKVMLEKVKSQKSWTGWTTKEQEVDSLKKEVETMKSELQFLRPKDDTGDWPITNDPDHEVVTVATNGCDPIRAHRSILISRSEVFKKVLTSEEFKSQLHDARNKTHGQIILTITMHPDSFRAFIKFLYTAELSLEVLKEHAPELMTAGDRYEIQILKQKCQEYILNNMTTENVIKYMTVAAQSGWTVITEAAVKKMRSNPKAFVSGHDYQALVKDNPAVLAGAFHYIILDPPGSKKTKDSHPKPAVKASDPGAATPGSDPDTGLPWASHDRYFGAGESSFRSLGTCTCTVHPFAHSASPGTFEYHGVHFNTATVQPSTVNYVNPPTPSAPDHA